MCSRDYMCLEVFQGMEARRCSNRLSVMSFQCLRVDGPFPLCFNLNDACREGSPQPPGDFRGGLGSCYEPARVEALPPAAMKEVSPLTISRIPNKHSESIGTQFDSCRYSLCLRVMHHSNIYVDICLPSEQLQRCMSFGIKKKVRK